MGNVCENPQFGSQIQKIRLIGVKSQFIPNKQSKVENYSYNIQHNIDKFEDEFFNKDFEFDLYEENIVDHQASTINQQNEKSIVQDSNILLEEKQTGTNFGRYNQMASEAFMNYIKERQLRRTEKLYRNIDNIEQKIHLQGRQHSPSVQVKAQLMITDIDSNNSNISRIIQQSRCYKDNFHHKQTSKQRANLNKNSSKQICKFNIMYY